MVTDWQTLVALLVVGLCLGCIGVHTARPFLRQNHKFRNLFSEQSSDLTEIEPLSRNGHEFDIAHKSEKSKAEEKEN